MKRTLSALAAGLLTVSLSFAADLVAIPDLGLRVQRGFGVRLVADNDTAPDTWCVTFDARGRLVVGNSQSIRTLTDTDGDDVADTATVFTRLGRGAMGLCFDGPTLYAVADDALLRFTDADGNGVADGPGEKLLGLAVGEHGAHEIRKGPDGWWYLMAGNDTGFNAQHVSMPESPIRKIEGGALLRLTPGGGAAECIADGFRNCYGFDFNDVGDLFTLDSDNERDVFLPWYVPNRLYHVGYGQHHGWRLTGTKRSWPRPEYYADTVDTLAHGGRGVPGGVVAYRHIQFPPAFRDGLFMCDWSAGRVYFSPLVAAGAGYTNNGMEVFLESTDLQGFAPTSIAVAPDGSLYVGIGGRKTRGGVYRIDYRGAATPPDFLPHPNPDVNTVLSAPQPLEAWSRITWVAAAQRVGAGPFAQAALEEALEPALRVRAIEVLTELFGGVPAQRVSLLAQSREPTVRARLAWSLGRVQGDAGAGVLANLALDRSPFVRRFALESLIERPSLISRADLLRVIDGNLAHVDKTVRLAATKLASRVPDDTWPTLSDNLRTAGPAMQLDGVLAAIWRAPDSVLHPQLIPRLTNILAVARDSQLRLDAVRVIILAMGDWHLNDPSAEVFTGYEPPAALNAPEFGWVLPRIRPLIPSGNPELDMEAARVLAILQDDDKGSARLLAVRLTETSPATEDFHYLTCLARLRAPLTEYVPRIARSVLLLDRKLAQLEPRVHPNWDTRLAELVAQLMRREPAIGDALLRDPLLPIPSHVELATTFAGDKRVSAARSFLAAVKVNPRFPWTPQLVDLLSALPREDVLPILRQQAYNPAVRDAVILKLATAPVAADRAIFLGSLNSPQTQVARASLEALLKLPPDASNTNLVAPLRALRRSFSEPAESLTRAQLVALISTSLKQPFKTEEPPGADMDTLKSTYSPVFEFIGRKYPGLIRLINSDDGEDPALWAGVIRSAPWKNGDAARGEQVFIERGCATCHTSGGAFGPDLSGIVQRMSRDDLMNAIAFPSRDIAPAFRANVFRLRNGQTVNGIIAYESLDGWLLQTGAGQTTRLLSRDVVAHAPSNVSVMPAGLLKGLAPIRLADLYAYLKALQPRAPREQAAAAAQQ